MLGQNPVDETVALVLDPGRGHSKKGYFWAIMMEVPRTGLALRRSSGPADYDRGYESSANIKDLLDEDAALTPRMVLVLRKLAQIRHVIKPAP